MGEECANISKEGGHKDEEDYKEKMTDVNYLKDQQGVPDFWYRAMKNSQMIWELVKERDEEILKSLRHIESERETKPKSLSVRFCFHPNDFFNNEILTLKICYKNDTDEVEKIEGTEITWKEGKDVTKKKVKKK